MLTPKSLLTCTMASFLKPRSSAYLAAMVPCSASEVMVRNHQPPVLPCSARMVKLGEEEAGEICTTPDGAVTEVRIGIDTDEMMPPMISGTFLISTSCLATSAATAPWLWASRMSAASVQPAAPPASLMSFSASSTALDAFWPYSPAGPVSSITTPMVVVQSALASAGASAAARSAATAAPWNFDLILVSCWGPSGEGRGLPPGHCAGKEVGAATPGQPPGGGAKA